MPTVDTSAPTFQQRSHSSRLNPLSPAPSAGPVTGGGSPAGPARRPRGGSNSRGRARPAASAPPEHVYAHRRLVEPHDGADLPRRPSLEMAQNHGGALAHRQPVDGRRQPRPLLLGQQHRFRRRLAARRPVRDHALPGLRRRHPPRATAARLQSVEAGVDENAREPQLEEEVLPKRGQVRERLEERVLNDLVHFGGVAEIVVGDARRPALLPVDDCPEPLGRLFPAPGGEKALHLAGEPGLDRRGRIRGGRRRRGRPALRHGGRALLRRRTQKTHGGIILQDGGRAPMRHPPMRPGTGAHSGSGRTGDSRPASRAASVPPAGPGAAPGSPPPVDGRGDRS